MLAADKDQTWGRAGGLEIILPSAKSQFSKSLLGGAVRAVEEQVQRWRRRGEQSENGRA
jgi:hypothetical protein